MSSYWPNSHAGSEHTIKQPQVLRKICLTWLKSWHTRFNVFSFFRRLLYHGGAITICLNTEFLHIVSLKLSVVVYDYIEMFSADESDSTAMLPVGGRLQLHSWIHPVTISQVGWPSSTSLQVLQRAIFFFLHAHSHSVKNHTFLSKCLGNFRPAQHSDRKVCFFLEMLERSSLSPSPCLVLL